MTEIIAAQGLSRVFVPPTAGGSFSGAFVYQRGSPAFSVAASHQQQITGFSVNYDTDSYWNGGASHFGIPVAGYYSILGELTMQYATGAGAAGDAIFSFPVFSGSHPIDVNWSANAYQMSDIDGTWSYEDHFALGESIEFWIQNGSSAKAIGVLDVAFIIRKVG